MSRIGTNLRHAVDLLRAGDVVAIPTETVYGLAGRIDSESAIRKIFEAKNRPFTDPLIVHVPNVGAIHPLVTAFPPLVGRLFEAFSPGPLTVLLPKSDAVSDLITNGSPWVALRIPNHPVALALLETLGTPLAAPSANPFGGISPTLAEHVLEGLGNRIPYILDGGPCGVGLESTIIKPVGDHQIQILRQGGIAEEELLLFAELLQPIEKEKTVVPGSLLSHYAPSKPLLLSKETEEENPNPNVGWLRFSSYKESQPESLQFILSRTGNLMEAAKNLFSGLHFLDHLAVKKIHAEPVPQVGLGKAINDRLFRASVKSPAEALEK